MTRTGKRRVPSKGTRPVAKITRRLLADVLARDGLFEWLDNERARPVVWVTGPPAP